MPAKTPAETWDEKRRELATAVRDLADAKVALERAENVLKVRTLAEKEAWEALVASRNAA